MPIDPTMRKRLRLVIAAIVVLAALGMLAWLGTREHTPSSTSTTGGRTVDPIKLSESQEIALGLTAAPEIISLRGGLSTDATQKELVTRVGQAVANGRTAGRTKWRFQFQLLAEPNILDAYALPGGQIFVTTALLNRLQTEGELAAVMAHQVAHVIERHSVKKLAEDIGGVDATGLPGETPTSLMATQLVSQSFAPAQETRADLLGLSLMAEAGYNPQATLGLFKILATAYYEGAQVEYFRTHPNPEGRIKAIQDSIAQRYPNGVPDFLSE